MNLERLIQSHSGLVSGLAALEREPCPPTPVLFAKIKLLWDCNLSCEYCVRPQNVRPMPADVAVALLSDLASRGLKKIHFSGGEIFLHPEIFSILGHAAAMGLQVNFTTNATLLDSAKIRRLAEIGIHCVSISLDSADAAAHDRIRGRKGAFKAALKAIRLIASDPKKYPKLRINTVVSARNAGGIEAMHDFMRSLGPQVKWKIIPVDSGRSSLLLSEEAVRDLAAQTRSWEVLDGEQPFEAPPSAVSGGRYGTGRSFCWIPWLHLFIDPSGYCYPCCMSRGKTRALGKYPEDGIESIVGGSNARNLRMALASGIRMKVCERCDDFVKESDIIQKLVAAEPR